MTKVALSLLLWLLCGFSGHGGKLASSPLLGRWRPLLRRRLVQVLLLLLASHLFLLAATTYAPRWSSAAAAFFTSSDLAFSNAAFTGRMASSVPPTPTPGLSLPKIAPLTLSATFSQPPRPSSHNVTAGRDQTPTLRGPLNASQNAPTMAPLPPSFRIAPGVFGSVPNIAKPPASHRRSTLSSPAAIGTLSACVFLVVAVLTVLIFGLIRARRDPARYGPRHADPEHPGGPLRSRSRAAGLTRAVLDTFPVTTWGALRASLSSSSSPQASAADRAIRRSHKEEKGDATHGHSLRQASRSRSREAGAAPNDIELVVSRPFVPPRSAAGVADEVGPHREASDDRRHLDDQQDSTATAIDGTKVAQPLPLAHIVRSAAISLADEIQMSELNDTALAMMATKHHAARDRLPASAHQMAQDEVRGLPGRDELDRKAVDEAGRGECCVICTETFSNGDEVRVLPCAGRHHFHVQCIDSWLVISPYCPLCRQNLQPASADDGATTRATLHEGDGADEGNDGSHPRSFPPPPPSPAAAARTLHVRFEESRTAERDGARLWTEQRRLMESLATQDSAR